MAIITLGSIVSEIRGSINGTTYSRNRGGPYAKNKLVQTNPNTTYQQDTRAIQADAIAAWQALAADTQQLWQVFAKDQLSRPRLGYRHPLSGYLGFVRFYRYRNQYGLTGNPSPAAPVDLQALTLNYVTLSQGAYIVNVDTFANDSDWQIVVRATAPQSAGVTSPTISKYRVITYTDLINGTSDLQLTTDYETHFGTLSTETGKKVFLQVDLVNRITSQHVTILRRSDVVQTSVAITFVGSASAAAPNGANVSISLTALGVQQGDLIIVAGGSGAGRTGKVPGPITAGFTSIYNRLAISIALSLDVSYMIAGASPPSSISCAGSANASDGTCYIAYVLRGVSPTMPIDVAAVSSGAHSSSPQVNDDIVTITVNDLILLVLESTATGTHGTVAGYSNYKFDTQVDTNSIRVELTSKLFPGPGTENPANWSTSAGGFWVPVTVAIRAALP